MISYIPIAIGGYLLNSISVLTDKFLLSKSIPNPLAYIFYISILSLLALLILPWTHLPSQSALIVGSASTILWSIGAYCLFSALKVGQASRVAPIIGTLNPIFLIIYYFFVTHSISLNEVWGSAILVIGMIILIWPYLKRQQATGNRQQFKKEFVFELLSALFFAASYVTLKELYNQTDFLSGLVWSKFILIPFILIFLAIPVIRKKIFSSSGPKVNFLSKTGLLMLVGQSAGAIQAILISYAVFLANPALVQSLQGTQYVFLFIFSLILSGKFPKIFDESFSKKLILQKFIGIILIGFGLFMLAFANQKPDHLELGYTYSPRYTESLGLNPKFTFIESLNDLSPKYIRLPLYWDSTEPERGKFDFTDTDYYVKQAQDHGTKVTLVIGMKVPRYPECFIPAWASKYPPDQLSSALFEEIKAAVTHYQNYPNLEVWQVENEPYFPFGQCPPLNPDRLNMEVKLVKSLDPNHPIMITESGEFGLWLTTAHLSDIVGSTLYRRQLGPFIPWFKSPLPPFFYQFKTMIVKFIYPQRKIYVSELQAEPWANQAINTTTYSYQKSAFPQGDIQDNVKFSEEAGFDRVYLWGVEWWYYLKSIGHSDYLNEAITLFLPK